MNWDEKVLAGLFQFCGMTTGEVADQVQPMFASNKRMHSAFIRTRLLDLEKRGLVCRLDDLKPVCWKKP